MSKLEVTRKIPAYVIWVTKCFGAANRTNSWFSAMILYYMCNKIESLEVCLRAKWAFKSRRILLGFYRLIHLLSGYYILQKLLILSILKLLTSLSVRVVVIDKDILSASTFHREFKHFCLEVIIRQDVFFFEICLTKWTG